MTGTMPVVAELFDGGAIDVGHAAHVAQVDHFAVFPLQLNALAGQYVGGVEVERLGLAADFDDLLGELLVDLAGQHALDDLQRGVVGVAASLDEPRLRARPRPWRG